MAGVKGVKQVLTLSLVIFHCIHNRTYGRAVVHKMFRSCLNIVCETGFASEKNRRVAPEMHLEPHWSVYEVSIIVVRF
jgi:hypothetical protein